MNSVGSRGRRRWSALTLSLCASFAATGYGAPDVPIAAGTTFVIAVSNAPAMPQTTPADSIAQNIAQGDYETVVVITAVNGDAVIHNAFIDGVDATGVRRQVNVPRQVATADLARSHLQVLGFHSDDPLVVNGTTSLGPSLEVVHELLTTGKTLYSFRNFASRETISGSLARQAGDVTFPVLLNGQRVALKAIRSTGQMSAGSATRPFEHYVLDHPRYPLSLRIAYGPRGGDFPFKPDFAREIVRIDWPSDGAPALEAALATDCHAAVPGIYFEFNAATLQPQSRRALQAIAVVLGKRRQQQVSIEGHTDNIGSERYNDDLSARRAAAVKEALVRDFQADSATLSTHGYGERQPIESNETLAGRARNRRVELVTACAAR